MTKQLKVKVRIEYTRESTGEDSYRVWATVFRGWLLDFFSWTPPIYGYARDNDKDTAVARALEDLKEELSKKNEKHILMMEVEEK